MIPGKRYTPEAWLRIAWRRKWLVFIPFVAITIGTIVVVAYLPNRYQSQSLILVVPQQVPEEYVRPSITTRLEDRLSAINQQILSRTRLEQIIRDFNLYREEREAEIMEDVVELMRTRDINIRIGPGESESRRASNSSSFRVTYTGEDPRTVMQVTARLASLFIEENLRDREQLTEGTNQFLESQLQDARARLIEQERRLESYKRQHAGQLPSQLPANLQAIQNLQLQIQALTQSISQDRDRRLMLDRLLAENETPGASATVAVTGSDGTLGLSSAQRLDLMRVELRVMETRLKPAHPDVIRAKRAIARQEEKVESEMLEQPLAPGAASAASAGLNPQEVQRQARLREMRAEKESLDRRIVSREAEEKRLRQLVAEYQGKAAAAPERETELVELTRDYETLRAIYSTLLANTQSARASANLERRQIGEQFKILDPARVPERPISPNRLQIDIGGALAGLFVGLGLLTLAEYRDRSIRTEDEVVATLALPVLASVPMMETTADRRRSVRRRRWAVVAAAVTCLLLVMAAVTAWKLGLMGLGV